MKKGSHSPQDRKKAEYHETMGKQEEQFTSMEWAELMGTNRPTYGRKKGGAFRQR
ncbi:hypothetical protein NCCP2222_18970 [Sporosarcina sp. NCCP-2222]|nr:hypothetical protein NCCP2222_18970 [Sporosarcina sp. NCCP-2222]